MAKTTKIFGLMLTALLFILACAVPTTLTPPPPGFVDTAIAETYAAIASQTLQAQVVNASSGLITPTGTVRASATPFPTFTVVVFGTPQVRALVDAPCRAGPGSIYDLVFTLREGRFADLVGKSADGSYWIIRNPNQTTRLCWVESNKVQVQGFAGTLPVLTPPSPPTATSSNTPIPTATRTNTLTPTVTVTATPTPIVQFDVLINGQDNCTTTSTWWVNFEVSNSGAVDFESLSITLTDTTTATDFLMDSEEFKNRNGCGPPDTIDPLLVGVTHNVSSPELNYDPTGRIFNATITLCTGPSQSGVCTTNTLNNFSP